MNSGELGASCCHAKMPAWRVMASCRVKRCPCRYFHFLTGLFPTRFEELPHSGHQVKNMLTFMKSEGLLSFNVHGSVHRKYIPIYIQQDAALHSLFISGNCCTCFGWYLHPSSGAHTTVSTASGICDTVTATCRYREGVAEQFQSLHDSGW